MTQRKLAERRERRWGIKELSEKMSGQSVLEETMNIRLRLKAAKALHDQPNMLTI